ncbi:hypothetical protein [Pandoraea pnomenusa]|uniref:Uncharacterized protein n=1 Tax=Pandoraea pnomenusa TaxID=93220 RepID=A0A379KE27_9BURK|nr:hypothetical protein [Pandoraea pnomenusa]SUA82003.1 Uncharacterised protein [Pandoraea pnomenusa]SUD65805.1 Uncharacterised protein [Pandoraea pnomenusa]
MNLVVLHAFGEYQKGDRITDADKVAAILDSEQATYVVKVAAPEEASTAKPKSSK